MLGRAMKKPIDKGYRVLIARYVRGQSGRLGKQLKGIRVAEDIELVHQARVACRRLRVALGMSNGALPAGKVKVWRRQIRRLGRSLGRARDRDVQIALLGGVLLSLSDKSLRPGVERVLLRLRQERAKLQEGVIAAADRFEAGGALKAMRAACRMTISTLPPQDAGPHSDEAFARMARRILVRLKELTACEGCLAQGEDRKGHHAMRIAGKRLRYTMEVCRDAYGQRLDGAIEALKRFQQMLGETCDCDVWIAQMPDLRAAERERTIAYLGHDRPMGRLERGFDFLLQERLDRRREVFAELVAHWQQLGRDGFRQQLRGVLKSFRGGEREAAT